MGFRLAKERTTQARCSKEAKCWVFAPPPKKNPSEMDRMHVLSLFKAHTLSAAKRDKLLRMLDEGVTDPCLARVSPALAKLWYASLPVDGNCGGAIASVRDLIYARGHSTSRYDIAAGLSAHITCGPLGEHLREWWDVTREPAVLEAVAWRWLHNAGDLENDTLKDGATPSIDARHAKASPRCLIDLLAAFKRQFNLRDIDPMRLVDAIALAKGWWTRTSGTRHCAFVAAGVEELLIEDEWIPSTLLTARLLQTRLEGMSEEEVRLAVTRMTENGSIVALPEGVTTRSIHDTSRAVKRLVRVYEAEASVPWDDPEDDALDTGALRGDLTDEQHAVVERVRAGHRLTLCCAPAGTGKTYTAGAIAAMAMQVVCIAPTWKALSVLRAKLGARVDYHVVQGFVLKEAPPDADVVIVDETSMLTMFQLRHILEAYAEHTQTRLLFLGDEAQLPCIGRGFPIRDLATQARTLCLTRCMRTSVSGLTAAACAARDSRTIASADGEVALEFTTNPNDWIAARDAFVDDAGAVRRPWDPGYVQMITPCNKHVEMLNEMVQTKTTARGGPSIARGPISKCYVGDAVRVRVNTDSYKNGEEGRLVAIEGATPMRMAKRARVDNRVGVVELRCGRTVRVQGGHIEPAYATTVHKVQGSEYHTVALVLFPGTFRKMLTREMLYTSVTRAKAMLRVVGITPDLDKCAPIKRRTVFEFV